MSARTASKAVRLPWTSETIATRIGRLFHSRAGTTSPSVDRGRVDCVLGLVTIERLKDTLLARSSEARGRSRGAGRPCTGELVFEAPRNEVAQPPCCLPRR